jgi:hypothetical protein
MAERRRAPRRQGGAIWRLNAENVVAAVHVEDFAGDAA